MSDFAVIIPVRWGSTRLHGKALADLAGRTLMQHVYQRDCRSGAALLARLTQRKAATA